MDLAAISKAKLGGLLGVNRGSDQQPRFVSSATTPGEPRAPTLALVGKGITFDSGGLSIKTGQGMMTMKCDMGGAAAVLGAMSVLPDLAPRSRCTAYLPMTDNMLGGDATRPGDVLTIRNGKTVEVLNTDAEGRLILADALSLASEAKPDAIVDLATLTGACMVALGPKYRRRHGQRRRPGRPGPRGGAIAAGERAVAPPAARRVPPAARLHGRRHEEHRWSRTAGRSPRVCSCRSSWPTASPGSTSTSPARPSPTPPIDEHPKGGTGFGVRLLVALAEWFSARRLTVVSDTSGSDCGRGRGV